METAVAISFVLWLVGGYLLGRGSAARIRSLIGTQEERKMKLKALGFLLGSLVVAFGLLVATLGHGILAYAGIFLAGAIVISSQIRAIELLLATLEGPSGDQDS